MLHPISKLQLALMNSGGKKRDIIKGEGEKKRSEHLAERVLGD